MSELGRTRRIGCGQAVAIVGMVLWLGVGPIGLRLVADVTSIAASQPPGLMVILLVIAAAALLVPYAAACLFTRRRAGLRAATSTAAVCAAAGGYMVLDAALRAVSPVDAATVLLGERAWVVGLRLGVLLAYSLLVAWAVPRVAMAPGRGLVEWLGLGRPSMRALAGALAVAALVTLPWPVTGALGDSLTSLNLLLQTVASVVPETLIFWGVIFLVLRDTFGRPWVAAVTASLLYALSSLAGLLPAGSWTALGEALLRLPLALLLSELRIIGRGVVAPLIVAYWDRAIPLLFVDPRDAMLGGVPEPQHIAARSVSVVAIVALSLAAGLSRPALRAVRHRWRVSSAARWIAVGGAALAAWALWAGLYVLTGVPGFSNHGFLIVLAEQADLDGAQAISGREARLEYVYQALVETAERSQAPSRAELDSMGIPYRPYYLSNMIRVDGHRWRMGRFEDRPDVAQVLLNPSVRTYPWRVPIPYGGDVQPVEGIQSNLRAIRADLAWSLGVTGEGIVVAGQDTGYDWRHPALITQYRGWDGYEADHDYNWHDAWDATPVPFDDDAHGTHTMGIVLGDDGGSNRTGVAPSAQWIGCRSMRRGLGNPGSYVECLEFFLAPYPHGGDPFRDGDVMLAPHVINNSWGCPDIEGCFPDTLRGAVEALRVAGIMVVVSAGNEGPACETLTIPPATYEAAFSVGATSDDGAIEGFSSRGPALGRVKPDVAAPGAFVRSALPGDGYGYAGGTSMAGPHVAGLVALLWSADPALIGAIGRTEALICQTAVPKPVDIACGAETDALESPLAALLSNPVCACGDVRGVPNNVYGCGFIDAGAAVQMALSE